MSFRLKLKQFRYANMMTQQQLADALGIDRSTYCNYESGRRSPDVEVLTRIAGYYRVTVDSLVAMDSEELLAEDNRYENDANLAYVSQLSKDEIDLIAKYRALKKADKKEVIKFAAGKINNK